MEDVYIGKGKLAGKGVFANRDFKKGELVKHYNLQPLTKGEYDELPNSERMFVHSFWGKMYLFPEPSRYTNHSAKPNTRSDLGKMCDYAIKDIKKGDMITTNATDEIKNEVRTYIEFKTNGDATEFEWLSGGYRNASCNYTHNGYRKNIQLKRVDGNWRMIGEIGTQPV